MLFPLFRVREYERALLFRHGDFVRLLRPGRHFRLSRLWGRSRVETVSTLQTRFVHRLLDVIVDHEGVAEDLQVEDLGDTERGLVWKNGRLAEILGPGRHAFWKRPYDLKVERFDISEGRFEHPKLETILAFSGANQWLRGIEVEPTEDVLLFRNGQFIEKLGAGKHVFWTGTGTVNWKSVDLREQSLDVAGQEIMTRDKVTLRVNLLVNYRVVDSIEAVTVVKDHAQSLYREAQLVLRAAVGTRTLDELLTDKETVALEVERGVKQRAAEFGTKVTSIGIRDVILPGEMKTILNQVISAEKQAQANLIRRREETAAARSQANTARLLAQNPVLARMKELEALQEILAGTRTTFVLGSGDLTEQVRGLIRNESADDS